MKSYKVLQTQTFKNGKTSIVPIRFEDRYSIMNWRNNQIAILRQSKPITKKNQDEYFVSVIAPQFDQDYPEQILFSYLENEECIGYGGLVHIDWEHKNAEISFLLNSVFDTKKVIFHWELYLKLIEEVAFNELKLRKIFTYAYDIRKDLFVLLENIGYSREGELINHIQLNSEYINVVIHAKQNPFPGLVNAGMNELMPAYQWLNSEGVRKYSIHKKFVPFDLHHSWYTDRLRDPYCEYYFLYDNQELIGSIRFDINDIEEAKVNYLIDPKFHGRGYGFSILTKGIQRLQNLRPEIHRIYGYVHIDNIPSIKIFEKAGFNKKNQTDSLILYEIKLM